MKLIGAHLGYNINVRARIASEAGVVVGRLDLELLQCVRLGIWMPACCTKSPARPDPKLLMSAPSMWKLLLMLLAPFTYTSGLPLPSVAALFKSPVMPADMVRT